MSKIFIQTALSLEFDAVKAFLSNVESEKHPTTGTYYSKGNYKEHEIILVEAGAGNVRSADECGRAIEFYKPDVVFFVGVAGGLKDVKVGDVVVSSKVIGFEMGKDDVEFKPRFDTVQASYSLEQLAKHVKQEGIWKSKIKVENIEEPIAFVQPIAAGEKVVSSEKSIAFSYLKKYCSEALAVDMEGTGFLVAARAYKVDAIEVRGISDLIENKSLSDAEGSQPRAAANAAAFCFEMIEQIDVKKTSEVNSIDLGSVDVKKRLVMDLVELYPQGPEQENIWKRAGGDVSIFTNATSRRSQWQNAIDKLQLGGGGKNITMETLVLEIKEDYPNYNFNS